MEKLTRTFITVTVAAAMLTISTAAWCAETSYIISLHRKIKSDYKELDKIQGDSEPRIKKINQEITGLVDQIESEENDSRREVLENRYYKLRAKDLALRAETFNQAGAIISRLTDNMRALDRAMAEGYKTEDGATLTKQDLPAIGDTLKGVSGMLKPLSLLKPDDPRIQYLSRTMQTMDARYRALSQDQTKTSLADQIAYMEDLGAFIAAVQQSAEQERQYLLGQIWTLMAENVARIVKSTARIASTWSIGAVASENHRSDERVARSRANTSRDDETTPSGDVNWDQIGKY